MRLRPKDFRHCEGRGTKIPRAEYLGDQTRLHRKVAEHADTTLSDPHSALTPGETVRIAPHDPIFFDRDARRDA